MRRSIIPKPKRSAKKHFVFEKTMVRVVWADGSIEWMTIPMFKTLGKRAMLAFSKHRKKCHRVRNKLVVHNPR